MPDGSSSAAPVTNPGPSSRNKIFPRLAGDFLISFLEEFMARSSNKAVQISRFFYAPQPTLPRLDDADLALGSVSTWAILGCKCTKKASVDGAIRRNRPTPTQHRSHHAGISKKIGPLHHCLGTHPIDSSIDTHQVQVCADIRSSGALRTHNEKPNGGAMPPDYSSRDDRCGIVRVAA